MSKRYWTADLHFGHGNIIEYCRRPFKDLEDMNRQLIQNINSRVKEEDTLIHVGDFATYGRARGVEGLRQHPREYVKLINGTFINIRGNHDDNNKVKSVCDYMFASVGPFKVSVAHRPSFQLEEDIWGSVKVDAHICGHVHEKWKTAYADNGLLNINVGVDQWKYRPIDDSELVSLIEKQEPTAYLMKEADSNQTRDQVKGWYDKTDSELRLACGEMTAQEIRSVRAVLGNILLNTARSSGIAQDTAH